MSATASSSNPHTATTAIWKEDPAVAGDPVSKLVDLTLHHHPIMSMAVLFSPLQPHNVEIPVVFLCLLCVYLAFALTLAPHDSS